MTYLKDCIDTETARWHRIHVSLLAYDSIGARVQKLCPSFTVMVITQIQKELPKYMLTLHKSCVRQNGTERIANAIAKYFAFLQELQTVVSNIKLPFTVDFFVHLQRLQ